ASARRMWRDHPLRAGTRLLRPRDRGAEGPGAGAAAQGLATFAGGWPSRRRVRAAPVSRVLRDADREGAGALQPAGMFLPVLRARPYPRGLPAQMGIRP